MHEIKTKHPTFSDHIATHHVSTYTTNHLVFLGAREIQNTTSKITK